MPSLVVRFLPIWLPLYEHWDECFSVINQAVLPQIENALDEAVIPTADTEEYVAKRTRHSRRARQRCRRILIPWCGGLQLEQVPAA